MVDNIYFLIPLAVVLFWIVRIFFLKDVNKVQLLISAGMLMAVLATFYRESFALLSFPFFYLAVRSKTSAKGVVKWDCLIFLPSLLLIPYSGSPISRYFLIIQIISISIWAIIRVRKYISGLAELFDSSSEEYTGEDIWQILLFIIFSVVTEMIIILIPDVVSSSMLLRIILSVFLAVLQYYIGALTFVMKDTSTIAIEVAEINEKAVEDSTADSPVNKSSDSRLIQRIIDEQLFLDPSLSLVSLSEKLHTNRTYLSSSIHFCRNQNFSDFINSLRVNYFMELVKSEGLEANIKEAAMRSGYTNMQSFYRNFSEIMQMTPKTWLSRNSK